MKNNLTCGVNLGLVVLLLTCCLASTLHAAISETGVEDANLAGFDRLMREFMAENHVPGAELAVARHEKLVYARGFGLADTATRQPVEPTSLFRIASITKPFTAVAILQLVEQGKLKLNDRPFQMLGFVPYLEPGAKVDNRIYRITVEELLHHRGGFDRDKSFDPMFDSVHIARMLHVQPPANQQAIIRYMMGRPLDFEPGAREAYSNFGYCVLGRVIERVSGQRYDQYIREHVLAPLRIHDMRLGHTLLNERFPSEVHYYDLQNRTGGSVFPPTIGKQVPLPYGAWDIEAMDSHGGWIASAVDLVRFGSSLNNRSNCPILHASSIETIFSRPRLGGDEKPKPNDPFYACGWEVRPVGKGQVNTWHNGALDGTSTLLVRRFDGLTWAVVFNTRSNPQGKDLSGLIDGKLHKVADEVKKWPERDLFGKFLSTGAR